MGTRGELTRAAAAASWARFDGLWGKRLAVSLPTVLPLMLLHGEWKWDAEVDQQQLLISAAT
jgi:hypothetical protein